MKCTGQTNDVMWMQQKSGTTESSNKKTDFVKWFDSIHQKLSHKDYEKRNDFIDKSNRNKKLTA